MATPTLNGAHGVEGNGSLSKATGLGHSQTKSYAGAKITEGSRKPTGSDEGPQRRGPPPKAWTSGMNPITQRANTPLQTNGTAMPARHGSQRSSATQDTNSFEKSANDRQTWLLGQVMGLPVTMTTKQGEAFSGLFAGTTIEANETTFLLKMVKQIESNSQEEVNGVRSSGDYIGTGSDYAKIFSALDVLDIEIVNVPTAANGSSQNGVPQGFRTDADISGNLALRERNLQRWEPSSTVEADMSLAKDVGNWDQFKANEQRFGVKSDYDENFYTTSIDRSNPLYQIREREAERIARAIENDSSNNAHVREERGIQQQDDGLDEEEKYSGVRRTGQDYPPLQSNQPNKYTPPARRTPNTNPAAGSPVDPAIISAQIAQSSAKVQETRVPDPAQTEKPKETSEVPKEITTSRPKETNASKNLPAKPTLTIPPSKSSNQKGGATENVEIEVLDSFRQFANNEKMKVQDSRRHRASADKAVKLNDLMKFAQNFKLNTPVPVDLVPILAKDKSKQNEIIEKAQRNAASVSSTPSKSTARAERGPVASQWEGETTTTATSSESQPNSRGRPGHHVQTTPSTKDRNHQNSNNQPFRSQQNSFSNRLADNHRSFKNGNNGPIPNPIPIHQDARMMATNRAPLGNTLSSPQHQGGIRSPTSATSIQFNVKAMEFRPNPAASTFKPTSNVSASSSPRTDVNTRSVSRAPSPSAFFGDRKPLPSLERPSILAFFNPIKCLKKEAENDSKLKDSAGHNSGIKPAYRTPPTWNPPKDGEEYKSYRDMFDKAPTVVHSTPPQHSSPVNSTLAHQHQLPLHLQNGAQGIPQVNTPQQVPLQAHPQPQHYSQNSQHFDDHHMRPSASSSSVFPAPSPRMQNTNMAYQSPMPHHAQLSYGHPVPQYIMGPNGPQPANYRHFSGGPQMMTTQGAHLAAPMMVQQPSGGGFMGMPQTMAMSFGPQMAMYPNAAPQPYAGPSQHPNGFPSPGRGAPMMMHQGSHQGQPQPIYMTPSQYGQPIYAQQPPTHMTPMRGNFGSPQSHYATAQNPYPPHHYPHHPHRTPSSGFAQLSQAHHQHMVSQQAPLPATSMEAGEEPK